jgi:hypothetical protein
VTASSERPPWGGLGRLALLGLAFALVAPLGLITLPLAGIALVGRPRTQAEWLVALLAGGLSLVWLLEVGDPPDQVVRAAAVLGTAAFLVAGHALATRQLPRALVSVCAATVAVTGWTALVGPSWREIRWWVEYRLGFALQAGASFLWTIGTTSSGTDPEIEELAGQLEQMNATVVPVLADLFPAALALAMMVGFMLAMAIARRVSPRLHPPATAFREFRFTEHLGWAAVLSLAIVLLPRLGAAKLVALNVLVVTGSLYALRGAAVLWYGLTLGGTPGVLTGALAVLSIVFLLPVVVSAAIVTGILDAGFDLRRRWRVPRMRD